MLANNITEEQRENYHIAKIQGELAIPCTWNSHQYCLEMLKGVKDKIKYHTLRNKLYERFSTFTNAHQTL